MIASRGRIAALIAFCSRGAFHRVVAEGRRAMNSLLARAETLRSGHRGIAKGFVDEVQEASAAAVLDFRVARCGSHSPWLTARSGIVPTGTLIVPPGAKCQPPRTA